MKRLVERNVVVKDWRKTPVKVALVYPGGYRAGMTGLTIQFLYHLFNLREDTLCERGFLDGSKPPRSLESGRTLRDFDLVAATIQYEEGYVELLKGLRDSGIPLRRSDRDGRHPLIVAGGPCVTANPTVLEDYVDVFAIGDGEALVDKLVDAYRENRSRESLLEALSDMPGFYVPGFTQNPVERVWVEELDEAPHPTAQVIPLVDERSPLCPVFGLTLGLEVTRGCGRMCLFCLASWINMPVRHRSLGAMLGIVEEGLRRTGVNKVSLVGAGATDNRWLKDLCQHLVSMGVEFSTPSLRMDLLDEELMRLIAQGGQRTLTLAPETASEGVRRLIGKPIPDDRLLEVSESAYEAGFRRLKLYFMIGLPGEDRDSLEGVGRLVDKLARKGFRDIHVSVNPLIPKAQTPFQWLPLASRSYLTEASKLIRRSMPKGLNVRLDILKPAQAELQALLSLGDRRAGRVVEYMALSGGGRGALRRAVKIAGLRLENVVYRAKEVEEPLPWDMIRSSDFKLLKKLYRKLESELVR